MLKKILTVDELYESLKPEQDLLLGHPVYQKITTLEQLQIFMESHSFAVWDFMTLLKSLQKRLTCVETPWIPPENTLAARFINEIVLCEETDEISPGHYRGHFELYVEAMGEADANGRLILEFVDLLKEGHSVERALSWIPVPQSTKNFVLHTTETATNGETIEVAASFLLGREDCIPKMFKRLLLQFEKTEGYRFHCMEHYLARHIEVDEDTHGPLARRLLQEICGHDPRKWAIAYNSAREAIKARIALWDGIVQEIEQDSFFANTA